MLAKRLFDIFWAILGLVVLFPFFLIIAAWIKSDSPGPVFFRQNRVGQFGKMFRIFKFRTMCLNAEVKGRQITVGEDPRITRSGHFLRKYKLDELPQLINVVKGDMSLVGPRPEVPRYVAMYPLETRDLILSVQPGITDYASIEYRDENEILGRAADPDKTYIEEIMPVKLEHCVRYVKEKTLLVDIILIIRTIKRVLV